MAPPSEDFLLRLDAELATWETEGAANWTPDMDRADRPPALIALYMGHFDLGRDQARAELEDILDNASASPHFAPFMALIASYTQALGARLLAPMGQATENLRELARRWQPFLDWLETEEGQQTTAEYRAQQEQPVCLCQCSLVHDGTRGVCVEQATTTSQFASPLTGPVDVPNCAPCAAAIAHTREEMTV